jgi:hypothetical protein
MRGRTYSSACWQRWLNTLTRRPRHKTRTSGSVRLGLLHLDSCCLSLAVLSADIFVGAQHKAAVLPQEWWTIAFRQAVCDIGHTVLVLQPWSAPAPLKRSWCLVR